MIGAALSAKSGLLMLLACNSAGVRAWQIVFSLALISVGTFLFYGSSRGRTIPFAAVTDKAARVLWTRIAAVILLVIGGITLLAAVLRLDC